MKAYAIGYAVALVKSGMRIGDASFLARNIFELTETERLEILAELRA